MGVRGKLSDHLQRLPSLPSQRLPSPQSKES